MELFSIEWHGYKLDYTLCVIEIRTLYFHNLVDSSVLCFLIHTIYFWEDHPVDIEMYLDTLRSHTAIELYAHHVCFH